MVTLKRLVAVMFLVFALGFPALNQVSYAEDSETKIIIQNPISLGKVTLKENVTAEVSNLMVMPNGNSQTAAFTVSINNNSNTDLNFIDYWVNVSTKNGTKVTIQTANNDVKTIPAKTQKDIVFYGKVGLNIKVTDLIIKVIKWDFSVPSYTNTLGQISVSQRYNPTTTANTGRYINIGDSKTSIYIEQATIGKSSKYYKPELKVVFKNEGTSSIALPEYQLYIQTQDNLLYSLNSSSIKGTVLEPLTEKEFQLTTSIPITVKENGWSMLVSYPVNEGKDKIPLALFSLPKANTSSGDDIDKYYSFTTSQGVYYVKMNSLNRLPIEDDDLVIANLTIQNKGSDTIPLPDFTGKFIFDDKVEKSVSVLTNNKIIALQPGQTMDFQVAGRIPYTFDVRKVSLLLQQKESGSTENTDLVEFTHSGTFSPVQTVNWDKGFKITDVGYRSDVKIRNLMTFAGQNGNVLAAQVIVTNEEKRLTTIQQLAGYFEKKDGTVFPATIQSLTDKLNPGGTALLYATASIPKDADVSDVQLVIGKAILETTQTGTTAGQSESVLAGYVSPYSFVMPAEKKEQNSIRNIDILPYKLSIERVATQIRFPNSQSAETFVKLDFDYTLEEDLLTKADIKDQKIIIELNDANQKSVFSKALPISNGDQASSDASLKVGTNTLELSWTDQELVMNVTLLKDYNLNIYHEIKPGYKKLIATEKIPWLVNRSFTN
ncbi:hypothetical protein GE107_07470 [Cohnella sp. CFH 77786]|uniref:hypothetical protein n=1 Tax=Cohnella sp. CFH 77786 TaxID=2662265 RepID=UPI001C60D024|nr:hypothetical protein [Cohnella sp. CFH 77786]MBW5445896.1 hypothetical protein [Cohnella sp. CFH 77786]